MKTDVFHLLRESPAYWPRIMQNPADAATSIYKISVTVYIGRPLEILHQNIFR